MGKPYPPPSGQTRTEQILAASRPAAKALSRRFATSPPDGPGRGARAPGTLSTLMFGAVEGGICMSARDLQRRKKMVLLVVALIVILALFGAGFALHVLWWVAIAALVLALIGFFARRA
jgi:hypothetical protein